MSEEKNCMNCRDGHILPDQGRCAKCFRAGDFVNWKAKKKPSLWQRMKMKRKGLVER